MRESLREFVRDRPALLRNWIVIGTLLLLVRFLVMESWDFAEGTASAARVIGYGVCLLGLIWADPRAGFLRWYSWSRIGFAVLWFVVTILPSIALCTILGTAVETTFDSSTA